MKVDNESFSSQTPSSQSFWHINSRDIFTPFLRHRELSPNVTQFKFGRNTVAQHAFWQYREYDFLGRNGGLQ